MTPTATRKKPSALAELERLDNRVVEAKQELQAAKERERVHAGKVHALRVASLAWRVDHPIQFRDGAAASGSQAEKLARELEQEDQSYGSANHAQSIEAAEIRLRRAEEEANRIRNQRGHELLAELVPEAEAAVERFKVWAESGRDVLTSVHDIAHRASAICIPARIDTREIPTFDHYVAVVKEVGRSADLPLPLPRSVVEGR